MSHRGDQAHGTPSGKHPGLGEPRAPWGAQQSAEQALADVLRTSRIVDWIYGTFASVCLLLATLVLLNRERFAAPLLASVLALTMATGALVLPRLRFGRSSVALLIYFLSAYGLIVGLSHLNGLGLRTPTLVIGPLLLFIAASLSPLRHALVAAAVALALIASLVPATPDLPGVPVSSAFGELQSAVISMLMACVMGSAFGRVLQQSIAKAAAAANEQYRNLYLEQAQRSLHDLVQTIPYAVVLTELESGRIALFNQAYARLLGWSAQDIEGGSTAALGIWVDPAQRARIVERVSAGQVVEETIALRRADGSEVLVRSSAARMLHQERPHLLAVGFDVSDEHRRQTELQAVMDTAATGIVVIQDDRLRMVSRHYERLMRLAPGQAVGQAADLDLGGPQALAEIRARVVPVLRRGEVVSHEHTAHRRDGSTFPARFTGRLINPGANDGFATVWLLEDISEQKAHEQALEKAREDALAASRAKTGFLAAMSHEIRTPLNGVLGLAELATDPQLDEAARQEYLRLILQSARSLADVISDVLDIAKIEAGKLELEEIDFDLDYWLASLRDSYFALAEGKGLSFVVQALPERLGTVRGDPVRLRQVMGNYLSNALKFTFKGEITLAVQRVSPSRLRLEVRDTGVGISEEARSKLFMPYTQASASTARQFGGTGLGLSICRELAVLMRGEVGVLSAPGAGSTFWLEAELPQVSPQGLAPDAVVDANRLDGVRVLLADDNRVNQLVGSKMLQKAGATVALADDGRIALDAVLEAHRQGTPFDVVLMDVQMPVMDGIEATRLIRAESAGQGLIIMAATAAVLKEELEAAMRSGMDAVVAKPFNAAQLRQVMVDFLGQRGSPGSGSNHPG